MLVRHVGQASLELLTSKDPPVLASLSARITGMSHHTLLPAALIICYFSGNLMTSFPETQFSYQLNINIYELSIHSTNNHTQPGDNSLH